MIQGDTILFVHCAESMRRLFAWISAALTSLATVNLYTLLASYPLNTAP